MDCSDDIIEGLNDRCYPIGDLIYDIHSMRIEFNRDQMEQLFKRVMSELDCPIDEPIINNVLRIIQDSTMSYDDKKHYRELTYSLNRTHIFAEW